MLVESKQGRNSLASEEKRQAISADFGARPDRRVLRSCKMRSLSAYVHRGSLIFPDRSSEMTDCRTPHASAIFCCVSPSSTSSEISFFQSMPPIIGTPNKKVNRRSGAVRHQNADMEETSNLVTLGQRMRWARKRAKLTQLQVRQKTGISQSNLSELEGDAYLSSAFVPQLAHLYGVRALWLSTGQWTVLERDSAPQDRALAAPRPETDFTTAHDITL